MCDSDIRVNRFQVYAALTEKVIVIWTRGIPSMNTTIARSQEL